MWIQAHCILLVNTEGNGGQFVTHQQLQLCFLQMCPEYSLSCNTKCVYENVFWSIVHTSKYNKQKLKKNKTNKTWNDLNVNQEKKLICKFDDRYNVVIKNEYLYASKKC